LGYWWSYHGINLSSVGTQTAALGFGGYTPSTFVATSASYNGSSWTGTPLKQQDMLTGAGTQTAALAWGGDGPPGNVKTATELWNGTSWTNPTGLNTARRSMLGQAGTQTAALAFGGAVPPVSAVTELWNGTSWTTSPN
jgi:hypothetical protein